MVRFILNQQNIATPLPPGMPLLDFIRYRQHLKGTKIGCREGDCGACTVLIGSLQNGRLQYQSVTSCLLPLANAHGKHVVTIEGLNLPELSPVQRAIVENNGTQCGFCTVGFVVSLTGACLTELPPTYERAVAAMDGNICRCTGYKSLERAAVQIVEALKDKEPEKNLHWLVANNFIPAYFPEIPERLKNLEEMPETLGDSAGKPTFVVSGGTDLLVQKPETVQQSAIKVLASLSGLKGIAREGNRIRIGGAVTVAELQHSPEMQAVFPDLQAHLKRVSSTQIRNMGTVAGNFANASPIGDLTIYFLALNATVFLQKDGATRELPLREFYLGYKTLDLQPGELIQQVAFEVLPGNAGFNFEKVSKRTHLDIATVNSALQIRVTDGLISEAFPAAGGVGPVPLFLSQTAEFLKGKPVSAETVIQAAGVMRTEIAPISDARGSAAYKRLLLRQLFYAHFLSFFPSTLKPEMLL